MARAAADDHVGGRAGNPGVAHGLVANAGGRHAVEEHAGAAGGDLLRAVMVVAQRHVGQRTGGAQRVDDDVGGGGADVARHLAVGLADIHAHQRAAAGQRHRAADRGHHGQGGAPGGDGGAHQKRAGGKAQQAAHVEAEAGFGVGDRVGQARGLHSAAQWKGRFGGRGRPPNPGVSRPPDFSPFL